MAIRLRTEYASQIDTSRVSSDTHNPDNLLKMNPKDDPGVPFRVNWNNLTEDKRDRIVDRLTKMSERRELALPVVESWITLFKVDTKLAKKKEALVKLIGLNMIAREDVAYIYESMQVRVADNRKKKSVLLGHEVAEAETGYQNFQRRLQLARHRSTDISRGGTMRGIGATRAPKFLPNPQEIFA